MTSKYDCGEIVAPQIEPSKSGTIAEVLDPVDGEPRYKVFHGPGQINEYVESQLTKIPENFAAGFQETPLSTEKFRARLNAHRLKQPHTDQLYSLHSARIKFIPFQFKPVLRFIRAQKPSLLIADEVGVGKTIEAGLIIQELESRRDIENIMVLCPKALVQKWEKEMRRFDKKFFSLDSDDLSYCLKETKRDGRWPRNFSNCIVHLELFRIQEYLASDEDQSWPGLQDLEPAPEFDLLIVDEAHHLRNSETNTHQLAEFLVSIEQASKVQ